MRPWTSELRRPIVIATLVLLSVSGCGGGGGGSSGGGGGGSVGGLGVQAAWQQPGGGTSTNLPNAVKTVRVVFRSAELQCCLAVDPAKVPINPATGERLLLLDNLPTGPATFMLAGYATDFAPAPPGVTAQCPTSPPGVGQACDPTHDAAPAFQSEDTPVAIIAGARAAAGQVPIAGTPFVFDLNPAADGAAANPVSFMFAVADAVTPVDANSIVLEVTPTGGPSRSIPVILRPCADGSATPCSPGGTMQVTGFLVSTAPQLLAVGQAQVRIRGSDVASPPHTFDFTYAFTVLAAPPTVTPTNTSTPTRTNTPTQTPTDTPTRTPTVTSTPTFPGGRLSGRCGRRSY